MDSELQSEYSVDENLEENCKCENHCEINHSSDYNKRLKERILSLKKTICELKEQLQDERDIWHREIQGRRELDYYNRYDFYDYDHEIKRYQDALFQSHYENRQFLQKQIAFANYKRRLLEVENMCTLELLRVKQSVQILQPLQMMAAEWNLEPSFGDSIEKKSQYGTETKENRNEEVSMPLESVISSDRISPCNTTLSEPTLSELSLTGGTFLSRTTNSQPNISSLDAKD